MAAEEVNIDAVLSNADWPKRTSDKFGSHPVPVRVMKKAHKAYLPGKEGPFRCDHCEYYPEPNRCNNASIKAKCEANEDGLTPDMITEDGLVAVDPDGCSDFFARNKKLPKEKK